MKNKPFPFIRFVKLLIVLALSLTACIPTRQAWPIQQTLEAASGKDGGVKEAAWVSAPPARPNYSPGELVDYMAQSGDSLPAIAAHFNTTVQEIRANNPVIPMDATTMPPGFPMKIPIYYQALWGSSFQILPDSLFVYGPAEKGFDPVAFVATQPGWLKDFKVYAGGEDRRGGQAVEYLAINFSISSRLILALLEYQLGALSNPTPPIDLNEGYLLGYEEHMHQGLYQQMLWAANTLNNAYYGWRRGTLREFEHPDRRLERPDPWQNSATVALQFYFSRSMTAQEYQIATHENGLQKAYSDLFGPLWESAEPVISGSLTQPEMKLPFETGKAWTYTGGPHTAWGEGEPYAAVDFAPPAVVGGCFETQEVSTAVAAGNIVRKWPATAVLDLDNDMDERTGWVVFYLHLATDSIPPVGTHLETGQPIGRPSCEGGRATGTHVHIARKYNGEWILADGPLAMNLEGWVTHNGTEPYQGTLVRFSRAVRACDCSDQASQIQAGSIK